MHQDNKTKKISIARKKLNVKFWACKNEFLMRVRLLLRIFLGSTCRHNQCNFRGNLCCASEKDRDLVRYCMKYVIINSIIKTRNRCSTHIYHIMFSKTNSSPNLFHGSHLGFGKSQFLSGQKGNFEPRFPSVWRQSRGRSGFDGFDQYYLSPNNFRGKLDIFQCRSNFFCTFPNFENFNHNTSDNSRSSFTTRSKSCSIKNIALIAVIP